MRLAIVALAALVLVACGTSHPFGTRGEVTSHKTVVFHEHSINLHPMPVAMEAVEGEDTEGASMILPDGSYVKMSGGGSAGNLMLVVNQNDGTAQEGSTKTDAQADITATANPTPVVDEGRAFYVVDEKGERR